MCMHIIINVCFWASILTSIHVYVHIMCSLVKCQCTYFMLHEFVIMLHMKTVYCVASKEETKSQDAKAITRKRYGQLSKNIYIRNYVCITLTHFHIKLVDYIFQ